MKFVKLHFFRDQSEFYVNMHLIISIQRETDHTRVFIHDSGDDYFSVSETPERILELLK